MPDEQPFPYQFEGGMGPFAEALHNAFRYKIRCPTCPGNPRQPGHNKDTAGKTNASGKRKRYWACQLSNATYRDGANCSKIGCSDYIFQAQQQLTDDQFASVLAQVIERGPPEDEDFEQLQYYVEAEQRRTAKSSDDPPGERTSSVNPFKKRKASQELPVPVRAQPCCSTTSLQQSHERLKALVEMSKTWQKQYEILTIFLAPSSPARPPPSTGTPPPRPSPQLFPRPDFPSDISIPCTYPDEDLVSSLAADRAPSAASTPPGASSTSSKTLLETPQRAPQLLAPGAEPSSAQPPPSRKGVVQTHVAGEPSKARAKKPQREDVPDDPTRTAHALVRKFKAAANDPETAKEVRRQVRQEAKDLNIATLFQCYLHQGGRKPLEPISPNKI
jgi:hypothetical protein